MNFVKVGFRLLNLFGNPYKILLSPYIIKFYYLTNILKVKSFDLRNDFFGNCTVEGFLG